MRIVDCSSDVCSSDLLQASDDGNLLETRTPIEAFNALIHPEDLPRVQKRFNESLRGERPYECEFRLRRGDGRYIWVLARAEVMRDATGRPLRMRGSLEEEIGRGSGRERVGEDV